MLEHEAVELIGTLSEEKSQAFWKAWDLWYAEKYLLEICQAKTVDEIFRVLNNARHDDEIRTMDMAEFRKMARTKGIRVPNVRNNNDMLYECVMA